MRKLEALRRREAAQDAARTPPGSKNRIAGAHADFDRYHYVFRRTQSLAMQSAEWENRLQPLKSWGGNALANLAWDYLGKS